MREIVTHGDICLKDEYNLVYKVADIIYTERELRWNKLPGGL